ncbi:MAG: T9SS type A sorting domain-containing protein, partial [Flavobacteriales bacterium]|nr:T9SS type A sorting domain-containing protein [Flavobacteriales bacterium]
RAAAMGVPEDLWQREDTDAGYLQFINNSALGNNGTTIDAINPPLSGYTYTRTPGQAYAPSTYDWRHVALVGNSGQSASDRMPDGNTFVAISNGYMYEVDMNGTVVWQYPDDPQKAFRYTCDHPGIIALLGQNPCGINTVVEEGLKGSIVLLPNPTSGAVRLEGINTADLATIRLIDGTGRTLTTYSPGPSIDLEDRPNGAYMLEVVLRDGTRFIERIALSR